MELNSPQADAFLVLEALNKHYPNGVEAVRNLSLTVSAGEVFGLVGPNGAGKSTLLKLIAGLLRPERGRVVLGGQEVTGNPALAAHNIGLMPDPLGVYTDISCREYLAFFGRVYGLHGAAFKAKLDEAVSLLGLGPWLDAEVETLSAGWQRRLALGRILLLDTALLLLDEPAAGLDIQARSELLAIVRTLAGTGRTVIISSHILPELEELATRFGIMNEGRWVEASPGRLFLSRDELKQGSGTRSWQIACSDPRAAQTALAATHATDSGIGAGCVVFSATDERAAAACLAAVIAAGVLVTGFRQKDTGLSDIVLRVLEGEGKT